MNVRSFVEARLTIDYADPVNQPHPRIVRDGGDVCGAFEQILDAVLVRYFGKTPQKIAAHLSGGVDSALVASAAAQRFRTVHTYAVLVPGRAALAQSHRRRKLINALGFIDRTIDAAIATPLNPKSRRVIERRVVPWEDLYLEAFDELHTIAQESGDDVLLTGHGGDELLGLYWSEIASVDRAQMLGPMFPQPDFLTSRASDAAREAALNCDRSPAAYIQRSAFEAIGNLSAQFLRYGIWAVHPLVAPELVQFCHALPIKWRSGKRIALDFLGTHGAPLSDSHFPNGDFGDFFTDALRGGSRTAIEMAIAGERLVNIGLVRPGSVSLAFKKWLGGTAPAAWELSLFAAAVLELTLACLETAAICKTKPGEPGFV
jgi:Asparagine synthase